MSLKCNIRIVTDRWWEGKNDRVAKAIEILKKQEVTQGLFGVTKTPLLPMKNFFRRSPELCLAALIRVTEYLTEELQAEHPNPTALRRKLATLRDVLSEM